MVPRATLLRTQVVTFTYEEANASHWYPPCLAVWFGARGTFPPLGNGTGRADRWARGRCVWDQRGDSTASSFTLRRRRGWDRCQTHSGHTYPEVKRDTDRSVSFSPPSGEAGRRGAWGTREFGSYEHRPGHSGAPVTARWGRPHGRSWDGSIRKEQGDRHAALGVGPRASGDPAHPLCLCPPRLHLEHNPEATQSGNQAEEISLLRSEWAGPGNVPRAFHPGLTEPCGQPPTGRTEEKRRVRAAPQLPPPPAQGSVCRVRGRAGGALSSSAVSVSPEETPARGSPHGAPAELRSQVFREQSNDAPRPSWDQPTSSVSPPSVTTAKRDESVL